MAGLHDDMRSACLSAGFFRSMVTRKTFETRVRELCAGQAMLEQICQAMLAARAALQTEYTRLHKSMLTIVRGDEVCHA